MTSRRAFATRAVVTLHLRDSEMRRYARAHGIRYDAEFRRYVRSARAWYGWWLRSTTAAVAREASA